VTTEERHQVVRAMIQHEDDLREQRLGWLLTLNGFLFAALGLTSDQPGLRVIPVIVAVVGFVVASSGALSMKVSDVAIRRLAESVGPRETWDDPSLPPIRGLSTEQLKEEGPRHLSFLYIWQVIPIALAVSWCAIFVVLIVVHW
jgi:hypothetical protein